MYAVLRRKEHLFIEAAEKLLQQLLKVHPQARREDSLFQYDLGVLHESRASLLLKERGRQADAREVMLAAARCYHTAARCTHQFHPSRKLRHPAYHALGKTFERLGELEMAKRAYLWAMTDPSGWR